MAVAQIMAVDCSDSKKGNHWWLKHSLTVVVVAMVIDNSENGSNCSNYIIKDVVTVAETVATMALVLAGNSEENPWWWQ